MADTPPRPPGRDPAAETRKGRRNSEGRAKLRRAAEAPKGGLNSEAPKPRGGRPPELPLARRALARDSGPAPQGRRRALAHGPHLAQYQYDMTQRVAIGNLLPGDLVFFGSPVHHVGMYIGGGYFVEAPHTGADVRVSKLAGRSDMVGARRYAWRYRVGPPRGVGKVSIPAGL